MICIYYDICSFIFPHFNPLFQYFFSGWCKYKNYDFHSTILVNWLYYVLFPYFIPLILCAYPFGFVLYKLRIADSVSSRDRNHFQIVLAVVGGYFFFHFLYYLLWFGRQMESLVYFNDRGAYRNFLSQPAWIIARPLFALVNLGWHICTPLGKYLYTLYYIESALKKKYYAFRVF